MRSVVVIVGMFALVSAAEADTVKGELTFDSNGVAKVMECKTGRLFNLGAMATTPYLRLVDQHSRLSHGNKSPVLVEVRGAIRKTDTNEPLTLESPNVVRVNGGRCGDLE